MTTTRTILQKTLILLSAASPMRLRAKAREALALRLWRKRLLRRLCARRRE